MQAITQHRKKRKRILLILILLLIGLTPSNAQIEGLLNGTFSINEQVQVGFSKGNLQYQASTNTWRFAEEQTDYIGAANSSISSTNSGWIDLFGWGTSGINHGAVCYQPWSTNQNNANFYAYGNGSNNLFSQTGQADWGYNAISNGGNQTGQWRTLTMENWYYLLYTRTTPSGLRFVHANINGIKGLLLLPDDWDASVYSLSYLNWNYDDLFESNTVSLSDWENVIEPAGAVFLPASGYRQGSSYNDYDSGCYWTSTTDGTDYADVVDINGYDPPFMFYPMWNSSSSKYYGMSVRLVQTVQSTSYTITTEIDPVDGGVVTGGGDYEYGQYCTLIASPNDGYSFCSWKEDGAIVSLEPSYGFTVTENRNLVADFNECGQKCNIVFNLTDSYGDGWNEAKLIVNFNGVPYRTLTLNSGYSGSFPVSVITDAHVSLEWISGYYDGECSFTLSYESGIPIFQMSSPSAGLLYEFDCNCGELFSITTISNPLGGGGTLMGTGYYGAGEICTLTAIANDVHVFENWTKDGVVVSDNPIYSFTVTEDATYVANFTWTNPASIDYVSDGLIMYVDGIYNTRNGHATTTNTWEDLMGNYDLAVSNYSSYTWEDNHFFSVGNGGYLDTGKAWKFFHSFNNDLTIEIVTYIDCDRTSPSYRGLAGWHEWSDGTNFQNDQGSGRMQTLGGLPVTEADDMIATVSYTKNNGSFLNGIWKKETNGIPNGTNSDRTVVFGNSHTSGRSWNDSIYCIRMYNRSLTPEEVAYNHSIDVERFHAGTHFGICEIAVIANPTNGGTVSGAGTYELGQVCTLAATANPNYIFLNWTKNGVEVSTNPTYSFTVTENATYTANFIMNLPELHVTGITHSTLVGGQSATISWTVQNDGTASTPNGEIWHDRVWLSVESRVAAGDNNPILLGTFDNLSALAPGEYYTQTQTFTLPLELSGSYYLFVLTDAYDCHTIYWGPEGVPLPYSPPPYIGCLSHHCSGDCANVADNRIYELSEYEYGNHGYAGGWGYYSDNFFYTLVDVAVPPLPDLQVTGIIPPDNFFSGTNVSVTAYITNTGDHVTYSGHWADALFIASEPDINSPTAVCLDVKQHSTALGAGQSYQVTLSGQVPVTMYGEAYFFVYTDCYNQVYEHVMNNNNITMSNAVNVILTPPADLVPTIVAVPNSVSTAENLTYSLRVNNLGAGLPNVADWVDKVYLSPNPNALDGNAILLKTHSHHGKTIPGAYYIVNETVSLPSSVVSGNYYLYVHTDANNEVFEYLYDDNNVAHSSVIDVLQPDLQVTQINAPEQITSGYPMNLSYTLTNSGSGIVNNRNVTDCIYISASGSMADTIRLASIRRSVYLQSGQSLTVMCNDLAPYNLTDGTFHLIVVTDSKHDINESNENNNSLSHYPMSIMHQPLPDLEPISLVLPEVVQAGENVSVQFDITNIGDMPLLNSNCTFDVYAVMGEEEILCPVQSQTLPLGNYVSIGINETLHFVRSVLVPPTVTSACTTFQLIANKGNQIMELDTTNNTFATNATVLDCPLPDLVVSNVVLPALQAGTEAQVSFTVSNNGTAVFEGTFGTAIYTIFEADTVFCPMRIQLSPEANGNYVFAIGESLQFTQKILVPPSVTSSFDTFYVMVDAENIVLESNEDNNITSAVASVTNYPFNLTTQSFTVPSTVTAGELTPASWTVKNTGSCPNEQIPFYIKNGNSYSLVNGEYLPTPWKDMILLSDDAVLSDDDVLLLSVDHNAVLSPNGTYQVQQNVVLPYNALGSKYLLCVSDSTQVTFDNNRVDNILAVPVEVELGVLPDLRITSLTVEPVLTSDNAYWVHYTVFNEGERVTQRNNWTDAFYISETYAVTGAFQLGSKIHNGALEVGASYTDSIEILAPNGLEGDYFLLGFTDATNLIYEHENENDNVLAASVTVVAPDPCDLIAVQPDFPTSVISGTEMIVSWQLRNIGSNPATGRIRNAVYLSADAEWSSDDKMLGYADMNINIAANGEQSCQLSGAITGFDEGNYYVIVKANILNALNESTYENNVCVSMVATEITFPTLAIGETIQRTIAPEHYLYYKIEVGSEYEGQALLCRIESLDHDLDVSNGLYISYGAVPTTMDFDYGVFVPYSHEQEIIIPALEQGTYYLMVQGAAFQMGNIHPINPNIIGRYLVVVPIQNISISASIVNFEILSVNANHGSNMGSVTTKVTGAMFEDVMDIRLVQGDEYLPAQKVYVNNSSEAYVTFDLTEMPLGTYTMEAELPGGVITVKEDAFTVEEGAPADLRLRLVVPASVRNGNTFPITLEYGNTGYTDLNVIGFKVVSRNGHPIGTTAEELQEGKTERIVYVRDGGVHYLNGMNPGFLNNKVLIMKATPSSNIKLSVYAIRRQ